MRKPIVLITGSNGRLGKVIRNRLSENYTIVGIDNESAEKVNQENYYQIDIANEESIREKLKEIKERYGNDFASIIHLAAYYSFGDQEWKKYKKITIEGTRKLLASLSNGFIVRQFIFSSTLLVYKPIPLGERITENSPFKGTWEYPKSKIITENILFEKNEHIPIAIVRIAGCYDDNCHSIPLSNQIKMVYEKDFRRRFFPGNIEHGAPFLHLDDLAEAIFSMVEKRDQLPHEVVLNMGESKTYSYKTIQQRLESLINNQEIKIYPIPKTLAKLVSWIENHIPFFPKPFIKPWMIDIADDHLELDISLAKGLLDWEPKRSLYDTLPIMVKNLKDDPLKWYQEQKLRIPKILQPNK